MSSVEGNITAIPMRILVDSENLKRAKKIISDAEDELKKLIRRYPTFADARAALTALNWSKGVIGQAESNWIAVTELDPRYADEEWLIKVRRWPPKPTNDLMKFVALS